MAALSPKLTSCLFTGLLAGCAQGDPDRPPNVVIVALDTLRPDRLGCYGHERDTSPNLDRLAADCVLFEAAQSAAPWTAPSLISLMTSLHPDAHGVTGFPDPGRLDESVVTLAEVLRARGYETAAFTEGGYANGDFGLDQGFHLYPAHEGDETGFTSNRHTDSRLAANLDRAIEWLDDRGAAPYFLFFQTYEPHSPYLAPDEDFARFLPGSVSAEELARLDEVIAHWNETREVDCDGLEMLARHAFHCEWRDSSPVEDPELLLAVAVEAGRPLARRQAAEDPLLVEWIRALYDAGIRYMDRELERLWQAIEESEQPSSTADRTLIVVVSDHGEGLGQHGRIGHGALLQEEVLNIVLLVRAPGVAPTRVPGVVRSVDVVPTVLELIGCRARELASQAQGVSLVPLMRGKSDPRPAFSQANKGSGPKQRSLRTERWRLVVSEEPHSVELFDRESDTTEEHDVSAQHTDVVARLSRLLEEQELTDRELRNRLAPGTRQRGLDESTRRELESLGYLGQDDEE